MKNFSVSLMLATMATTLWAAPPQSDVAVPLASISQEASRATSKGAEDRFTGNVRILYLFPANTPSKATGGQVTFDAGSRTAWHAHPVGQTLIVTSGTGRVQFWGGPIQEIKPGDVVWIPPGQKHWHGASPINPMTHISVQEQLEGQTAQWFEKVTDEQYGVVASEAPPAPNKNSRAGLPGRRSQFGFCIASLPVSWR